MIKALRTDRLVAQVAVAGLGKTGVSCVNFLLQQGVQVLAVDTREKPPGMTELPVNHAGLKIKLGRLDLDCFLHSDQVIVSPGLALNDAVFVSAQQAGIEVIGDIELFARYANAPVIAITGSNGKSTVTCLVRDMLVRAGLRVAAGGNLGIPALDLLSDVPPDYYVLELSSFQLESVRSLTPTVAVNLNVSADHMDRYPSLQAYAQTKQRVYQHAAHKVVNQDDTLAYVNDTDVNDEGSDYIGFTLGVPDAHSFGVQHEDGIAHLVYGKTLLMAQSELALFGQHNVANALATFAIGYALGINHAFIRQTLMTFQSLPHRTELVVDHQGVKWINDSKGTNVGATVAALRGMLGPLILIAGGDGKGADFMPLREIVAEKVKILLALGKDAAALESVLGDVVPCQRVASMTEAVMIANKHALPGESVLLSPACASVDMFVNYQARGQAFTQAIKQVIGFDERNKAD